MVIIIAPGPVQRECIASFLKNTPYEVVVCASQLRTELPRISYTNGQRIFAIVGVDGRAGSLDRAAENIGVLRSFLPHGKVVLVIQTDGSIGLHHVLALSSDACIFNLDSRDTLIRVLELTSADRRVFVLADSTVATLTGDHEVGDRARLLQPSNSDRLGPLGENLLSPRERQILTGLAEGRSNKAIARLYNLAEATVKVHLKSILRKTKAQNRTQAAIWAIEAQVRKQGE